MADLTPKQQRFVEAYVGPATGNATQAARIAGYKGNDITLAAVGHENLRKPRVAEAVKERTQMALDSLGADEMLRQVSRIALGEEPKARIADRLRALELMGKYHALWTDVQAVKDLPKDERELDALLAYHLKRVAGRRRRP